jgi:hypothetical protein
LAVFAVSFEENIPQAHRGDVPMKRASLVIATLIAAISGFAQQTEQSAAQPAQPPAQAAQPPAQPATPAAQPQSGVQTAQTSSKGCLAVKPIGSHAFRNIMLLGITGALISKQQYQIVDAVNYPARVGQKFHGNDLQTIATNGTKVVILDKNYSVADLQKACQNDKN